MLKKGSQRENNFRSLKKKSLFNGILLVNKTSGCTSHDVVQKIRHIFHQKAVGHAGTLDPMAEGLLVILLGQATKLSQYLLNNDKRYTLKMKFGLVTDTFDRDGNILKDESVTLDPRQVETILKNSIGEQQLEVPYFSAVKVKGKKLYSYAREGKKITLPVKAMFFYDLNILKVTEDTASVSVSCSKGSYMRSWVHFIGEKLGAGASLTDLTRDKSLPFCLSDSVTVAELEEQFKIDFPKNEEALKMRFPKAFLLTGEALSQYSSIELTKRDTEILYKGQIPGFLIEKSLPWQMEVNKMNQSKIFQVIRAGRLVALLELRPFQKIKILKNLSS